MAGIVMMVAGAVLNASAFIGGNAIFHAFDAKNASIERKRHDFAIEKLQKENILWNEKRIKHLDYINKLRQKKLQSKINFKEFDQSIVDFEERKPVLNFHLSEKQNNYEKAYIAAGIVGSGLIGKFI